MVHFALCPIHDSTLWLPILSGIMTAFTVAACFAALLYVIRRLRVKSWGVCTCDKQLLGKVMVITGANSGLGKEVTMEVAKRGATVVMVCRDKQATLMAMDDIRKTTRNGELLFMKMDLADLASVDKCATDLLCKFPQIDVLVNNAGIHLPEGKGWLSKDGIEMHLAVNHLGHFLLTNRLMHRFKETTDSRIVIVSSQKYKNAELEFDTQGMLQETVGKSKNLNPFYCNSKLANMLHATALRKRLQGTGVGVYTLCPGFAYTNLFRHSRLGVLQKLAFLPVAFLFLRTAAQGAQTILHCIVSDDAPGFYYNVQCCKPESKAEDEHKAELLWRFSSEIVKQITT